MTIDELHYGPEPGVDYFKDGKSVNAFYNWYNYMWDRKQSDLVIMQYAKQHGYKNASKLKKLYVPGSVAYIIRGLENGVTFPDADTPKGFEAGNIGYQAYIHEQLRKYNKQAVDMKAENIDTSKTVTKRKTVQENIDGKVIELLGEVDHAIDVWDCEPFDMYQYLTDEKVSAAVANKIPAEYKTLSDEMTEVIAGTDKQLKEAYSYMSMKEKKTFLIFVDKIISDTLKYADNNKPIRKPRKAKQYSATKLVEKLQYLEHDTVNQVKSIDASKIIGAKQLWLFNSKTNEIIQYDQIDRGGLTVKGTTLLNFNPKTSCSKKLGVKTDDVLERVLSGGTIVLNKCMSEINSKASDVTGRINNNMIILKVD